MIILSSFIEILSYVLGLNLLLALIVGFIERKNPTTTLMWMMIVYFLPVIGFIVYLFLGLDVWHARKLRLKNKRYGLPLGRAKTYITNEMVRSCVNGVDNSEDYIQFINFMLGTKQAELSFNNKVEFFNKGEDKFKRLIADIECAKKSVYLEYYIIKDDNIGKKILDLCAQKARSGLDVIVIADGMGNKVRYSTRRKLKRSGVKFVTFLKITVPFLSFRMNYRNHRKIAIIDGKIAYVGGINIGDEYINGNDRFGFWRDAHIRLSGNSVDSLKAIMNMDIAFASNYKILLSDNVNREYKNKQEYNKAVLVVYSGPDTPYPAIRDGYMKMIAMAKKRIYIQTPYFIPDDGLLDALKIAALSGVDVRIMTPNKPDHVFVKWAGISYFSILLEAGAKIYLYKRGFIHSKVVLIDDKLVSVGTANFDIRSFILNFEVNSFIFDEKINNEVSEKFNQDQLYCHEYTLRDYSNRKLIDKIREKISRLLSPLL